jgi:outer membrane protein TolC
VERARLQVRQQQMLASVTLIRALGGGWEGRKDEIGADYTQSRKPAPDS